MLVLTRRVNAGDDSVICIGGDIEITLVEVKGDQVRLGVQAPRSVIVDRTEIWEQKRRERQGADEAEDCQHPDALLSEN